MPSSPAFLIAGRIASASMARMIRTFAPFEIRLSTSASCLVGEPCASAETYFAPEGASAALIAASSVFQRSSWKFDHDTPTTMSLAMAEVDTQSAAKAAPVNRIFLIFPPSLVVGPPIAIPLVLLLGRARQARRHRCRFARFSRYSW